ncbi:MAG: phenylacetate--CoA ligase [Burkholderiaceae bacterium]|nr:phenylacetate--CoA ligase [Burkholderiaceae bacterium]
MSDRRIEAMPRERLAALQLTRLRRMLGRASGVALHAQRMAAAGVDARALRSLDDLRRLPFTVKDDLRANYPFGMLAGPLASMARLHASSGTTGKPTVVGCTPGDISTWAELMARSMVCAGVRRGELVHNAYGYGLFTGGLGAHYGAEALGCPVVPMSGGNTEKQVTLMADFGARVLCSTPSYALAIAEEARRQGVDLRACGLRLGLFGAEPWSESMRDEIQSQLGIVARDVYGLSEIMGPGVAIECVAGPCGLHGWEDHFIFEVIDPETGEPVPEGNAGELVITTLSREAMPMIRYRTRDITRVSTAPCDCGRTHLRLQRITGRSDDMLIIRGVNVYPSQIEAVLVGLPEIAPHYQLVVDREGVLDRLVIEVELDPAAMAAVGRHAALAASIRHHVKSMVGVSATVTLRAPGEIPRSAGKAVRVRDLRHYGSQRPG